MASRCRRTPTSRATWPKRSALMALKYVVITSVDRDDLRDGGAEHFAALHRGGARSSPATRIEILTPDFRGRLDKALDIARHRACPT